MVRRQLKAQGIDFWDLGREKFVEKVWEWKAIAGGTITNQLRRLGVSCDWSRERFTLDDDLRRAVREHFVTLYEQGLIYRGERLINWDPSTRPRCPTSRWNTRGTTRAKRRWSRASCGRLPTRSPTALVRSWWRQPDPRP